MIKCPLTGSTNVKVIYEQPAVPLIQNKVYKTKEAAINAPCKAVTLAQSLDNGFVFSANFTDSIIDYDLHYQNEQSNSAYFRKHLDNVIEIMEENNTLEGKVVEIGCGKAYFMDMLLDRQVDIIGFDPTYEGHSPKVIKDFFSDKYADIGAEFIILRHTLEHISAPFQFIQTIAAANKHKGKIYIEVPTFEWILKHKATEDIFYEHCNYFTLATLQMLFTKSIGGHFFNGQYIYVIADLADVKEKLEVKVVAPYEVKFKDRIEEYGQLICNLKNVAIWGAGAKGSTFLNLLDKRNEKVKCVIDINPKKQHQYIGGTGHYIIKPNELTEQAVENVIVMNVNYIDEIKAVTGPLSIKLITL
jgi:2-polyprenyl-3-methyl-5-hydroxy-6-metoxy-1,4-benzoquinol methylase